MVITGGFGHKSHCHLTNRENFGWYHLGCNDRLSYCPLQGRASFWWCHLDVFFLSWWFICFAFVRSLWIATKLDWGTVQEAVTVWITIMVWLHVCTEVFHTDAGFVPAELGQSFIQWPFCLHLKHVIVAHLSPHWIISSNCIDCGYHIKQCLLNYFNKQEFSFNLLCMGNSL